ncbi:MAG: sugar phosphate nucleotidyltransferase, partial [Candidatus Bathyarchaeia archaeon]
MSEAIILAGGQGLRLRPLTSDMPKPMIIVGGRPIA